jgi:trehalose synthase-fused probable maltokinase
MIEEQALVDYIGSRRWFGSKTRELTGARVVETIRLRTEVAPRLDLLLVEVRFPEGTHETYQVPVGFSDDWDAEEIAPGAHDALADPTLARELVHLIRAGRTVQAEEGVLEFGSVAGFAPLGAELTSARLSDTEQTNTSVIFGEDLILKSYRRLEAGINPELEMLRFLTERGFPNIPALGGWYAYSGRPLDATLGVLQEFVPNGIDGWELALDELAAAPERFLRRLRRLGEVTGAMHSLLGSDSSDPSFSPEQPSIEMLGLLTATVDEEIERVFLDLPEDDEAVAPILGRGEEVRERLRALTNAGGIGRIIRHHGDFHLGQTLWDAGVEAAGGADAMPGAVASGDWVILDFEGEPARSLPERRRKRSPLRDVAGMLRSFAYAASAAELLRGTPAPEGWEERARQEFADGYLETVEASLLPPGREATERLLSVFELEKAVYELRYELNNRPEWVQIPVAGILRLLDTPVGAA